MTDRVLERGAGLGPDHRVTRQAWLGKSPRKPYTRGAGLGVRCCRCLTLRAEWPDLIGGHIPATARRCKSAFGEVAFPQSKTSGRLRLMQAILGSLVGGLVAILGGMLVALTSDQRERRNWTRDAQLKASADLLTALQTLTRRLLDLAFLPDDRKTDRDLPARTRYHDATIEWNSAMYRALLINSPELAIRIRALDREVDRLLDLAMSRSWRREEFREQRKELGRLAAGYLQLARNVSGLPDVELTSIWAWDIDPQTMDHMPSVSHNNSDSETLHTP